jgi:signal transduction histidine kinase
VPIPKRWRRSATALRLSLAFAAIIAVFGVASAVTRSGFGEVNQALQDVHEHEESVRLALELASAVRDQYAHQAHTIIIGDQSHLGFYAEAQERVLHLAHKLRERAENPPEAARVEAIELASAQLDDIFRTRIVPAVLSGETEDVHMQHDEAQTLVSRTQDQVDAMVHAYETDIAELQRHAATVEASANHLMAVALLVAFLLAGAIGVYITRTVTRPVARLREGAARVSRGDLAATIAVDGADEFAELADQFNAMTTSLRDHQHKLLQSERLAGIGRLAAGVAHEINNPLGVILGYTRLLEPQVNAKGKEDLAIIEDEVVRCREIVEGLLDLSRPIPVPDRPVNLRELCDEVAARLRESAQGVRIDVEGRAAAPAHEQKLRQVVMNLVKNASEACGAKGTVTVVLSEGERGASIRVLDTGPGLPEASRARLFEPFFTTKPSGTGLGLAVSRAIVRAHGGEIEVGPGEQGGAEFRVWLPAARAHAADLAATKV